MPGIVCAIRGGAESQLTVQKAIELGLETQLDLYFLYVVNVEFLSHTMTGRVNVVSEEMHHMGEFILLAAQEEAEKAGMKSKSVVRHGVLSEEIIGLAQEVEADYVVLGQPRGVEEGDIFSHDRLREFGDHIEAESGAKVVFAEHHSDEHE